MSGRFDLLFVYGSLLSGQSADGYLAGLVRAPATTPGCLYRSPAGYPGLVWDEDGDPILGEVVRFANPGLLRVLDLYEGVAEGLFTRERKPIVVRDQQVDAWVYTVRGPQVRARRWARLAVHDWRKVAPPVARG